MLPSVPFFRIHGSRAGLRLKFAWVRGLVWPAYAGSWGGVKPELGPNRHKRTRYFAYTSNNVYAQLFLGN